MNYKILKFILQPLVENAIFHGLEPKRSKGLLTISAEEVGIHYKYLLKIMELALKMKNL